VRDGRIAAAEPWRLHVADAPAGTAGVLALGADGECVFHQGHRCAIHAALGHHAMPIACQHFPRLCLIDPRGVFVTLSHFCPTAAAMLFDEEPVSIVEGPPALPDEEPEGLDARGTWPPLLTDRVLMDLDAYDRWERRMVSVLAGEEREPSPEAALSRLRSDASAFAREVAADASAQLRAVREDADRASEGPDVRLDMVFDRIRGAVPAPLMWPGAPDDAQAEWARRAQPAWPAWAGVAQRFLAAHAFGSWVAYQGRGLHTIVRAVEAALVVLKIEIVRACQARDTTLDRALLHDAIRQADLLLRHYVDRQAFANTVSTAWRAPC
jgi:hypothetical protein